MFQAQKHSVVGSASHHGSVRTARQHRSVAEDNPSITVTRLGSAQNSSPRANGLGPSFRPSATGVRQSQTDRKGYTSLSALPLTSNNASVARNTTNHRLGTLRGAGPEATRLHPQRQRDIALSALRSGDHWSTTYGNDYAKQFSRR